MGSLGGFVLGIDSEGDAAIVGIVRQRVNHHGENHDNVLTSLLHREERDDVVGQVFPTESFEQNPADAQLQRQADQETAYKQQQLALEVVLGLEHPVAVPQETVNDAEDVTHDIGDTVGQAHLGVENIENDERDECVQHTDHTILEQLYARLSGFVLIYLHDNSIIAAKLYNFNELTKYISINVSRNANSQ